MGTASKSGCHDNKVILLSISCNKFSIILLYCNTFNICNIFISIFFDCRTNIDNNVIY